MSVVRWAPHMPSLGRAVVAIGVFDGVHVGHQALVRSAVAAARRAKASAVVVTFDRDPDRVVSPAIAAPQLLPVDDKLELLSGLGPDAVLVVPFDERTAALSPDAFLDEVLLPAVTPIAAFVGNDFRFGKRACGDVETLGRLGLERGFSVTPHDLVTAQGLPVTSTRIRALIASGDVARAVALLGRPHRIVGEVVRGRGDGRELGVPTANVLPPDEIAVPAPGVYAGRAEVSGTTYAAAVSAGKPPSIEGAEEAVEAHLLGFSGDLYGRTLRVEFLARIRDLRRFDSREELRDAIAEDIDTARRLVE